MFDRSPSIVESFAVIFGLWLVSVAILLGVIVAAAFIVKAIVL